MARNALALAHADPGRARLAAAEALAHARGEHDHAAAAMAYRVLGLAAREDHHIGESLELLRRAVRTAQRHDLPSLAAQARMSLSGTLAMAGDLRRALREADRAGADLTGLDRARLEMQRATILMVQGRLEEALDGYRHARPLLAAAGDRPNEATLLANRGLVHTQRGQLGAAEADLRAAERLYDELGHVRAAADVRQNLGFLAARRGDLLGALAEFARADEYFRTRGAVDALGLRDRCEALLPARLITEARDAAEQAVTALQRSGLGTHLPEAQLMLAEAALLDGDPVTAREEAGQARRAFARQDRARYCSLATAVTVRAAAGTGERSPALLAAARRAADALAETGWTAAAVDARLLAAQLAGDLGRPLVARRQLAAAAVARARGPASVRARGWYAEAQLRLGRGDRAGAERALRAGVRVVDRYRTALGATDLRARASAHGTELAGLGLRMALEAGDARRVLGWAERWRAGALQPRPARPPVDERLAADLAALRTVAADVERAALDGGDADRLLRRQARLEESVRDRARLLGAAAPHAAATPDAVDAVLGDRVLVEFVESDGAIAAVTVTGGRVDLHRLAPLTGVSRELDGLRFALRRLGSGGGRPASLAAASRAARHAAARLDELLVGPVRDRVADRPVVIVPTGALHAVPWSALPALRGRPVSVAPSAALFARAASAVPAAQPHAAADIRPHDALVLVAGPTLPAAAAEVAELGRRYPRARVLSGAAATAAAACGLVDGAALAHLAAHGRFRRDNPLFSSLQLADGPLTVYDLEGLRIPPSTLVLSACDSGVSEVGAGDELLGLTAALLGMGTRAVVASVLPVPDAETLPLMLDLHAGLAAGLSPAEALAAAQVRAADHGVAAAAGAAAFVCFGAG